MSVMDLWQHLQAAAMGIEVSTLNVALGSVIAMQAWIIREVFALKQQISLVQSHCKLCRKEEE